MPPLPLFTFTDFGSRGPYPGQVEERIFRFDPHIRVIHLLNDAPAFAPLQAGCLLAALADNMGAGVFLAVVDPGVGGERLPVVIRRGEQWFVGPDNGLFAPLVCHNLAAEVFTTGYRPEEMSATFHGRISSRRSRQDWPLPALSPSNRSPDLISLPAPWTSRRSSTSIITVIS